MRRLAASFAVLVTIACTPDQATSPKTAHLPTLSVALGSFTLPVEYPTGLASDGGTLLYLSTGSGFRETHVIDRVSQTDIGTIPTGGNPRDVTSDGAYLYFSDLGGYVVRRSPGGGFLSAFSLPFRGGGIARAADTVWVGDIDSNQLFVGRFYGSQISVVPSAVRIEGLAYDPADHTLWAITPFAGDNRIYELTTTGSLIRTCDVDYEAGPYGLGGIALVRDTFYIAHPVGGNPTLGTRILMYEKSNLTCSPPFGQPVSIKLSPNKSSPWSGGFYTVWVLSDVTFDATTLVPGSLRLGPTGTEAQVSPMPNHQGLIDVDRDGDMDYRASFFKQDTGLQCGDTQLTLTGQTGSGQRFYSSAPIRLSGCP